MWAILRAMRTLSVERRIAVLAGVLALVLHLATAAGYGWFRDELYYVACGEHLAWGYVDHPPFVALMARLARVLGGDSPVPLRALAAVAGAVTITTTGLLAERMGAKRFGVALACLAMLFAPLVLSIDGFFSMNAFDLAFCALAAFVAAGILGGEATTARWVWLGVVVGVGLENKLTIGFLAFGLFVGLAVSPSRGLLRTRGPWLALAIAFALWLPNLVWQARSGWMTVEFMNRARLTKHVPLAATSFLLQQVLQMHPLAAPVWLGGLGGLLLSARLRAFRPLGIAYLIVLAIFLTQRGKPYYVGPAYAMLFAAGGVTIESLVGMPVARGAVVSLLTLGGLATLPLVVTVLSPESLLRYQRFLGKKPQPIERGEQAELEQRLADEFGWDTLVAAVADARDRLPADEREDIGIFGRNYGEAAAVDVLGGRYGLPHAMSDHNNYWLWGPRGRARGPFLLIGGDVEEHRRFCGQTEALARRVERFAMPYERDLTIYVCRDPVTSLPELWPSIRHFD